MDVVGAKNNVQMRGPSQEFLPLLLGNTSSNTNDKTRLPLLIRLEGSQITVYLLFCLASYAACIEDYKVCLFFFRGGLVIMAGQEPGYLLRVAVVHLTAMRFNKQVFFLIQPDTPPIKT